MHVITKQDTVDQAGKMRRVCRWVLKRGPGLPADNHRMMVSTIRTSTIRNTPMFLSDVQAEAEDDSELIL